jgi:hypothetical protein
MARTANVFTDPAGVLAAYPWPINHLTESQVTKSRQMADGAPTSDIGLIPQQGPPSPLIFEWSGTILDEAQHRQFLIWWVLCEVHSIFLTDFAGSIYEVLITDYLPTREAVARNPRFPNQLWIYKYSMTLRILTVFSGPWLGVPT